MSDKTDFSPRRWTTEEIDRYETNRILNREYIREVQILTCRMYEQIARRKANEFIRGISED